VDVKVTVQAIGRPAALRTEPLLSGRPQHHSKLVASLGLNALQNHFSGIGNQRRLCHRPPPENRQNLIFFYRFPKPRGSVNRVSPNVRKNRELTRVCLPKMTHLVVADIVGVDVL
jgi:hypothetical protein